jgi:hypothetical protein
MRTISPGTCRKISMPTQHLTYPLPY